MKKIIYVILIFLCNIYFSGILIADNLPGLPDYLKSLFADVKSHKTFSSASELELFFKKAGYDLEQVCKDKKLPQLYVANLPTDLNKLSVPQKTSLFIRLLLTSVVKVNNDILAVRKEIKLLADKKKNGKKLSAKEQQWLDGIAADHYFSSDNLLELLVRVDVLPVDLIMAQAIDESGWGTSHFSIAGNALYGQHLPEGAKGTFLTTPGGHVRVESFDNLYHCTASYIHNINTTNAYKSLRDERAEIRRKHGKITGDYLAGALIHYSARGQKYVDMLRWIIKHYNLDELENVQLDNNDASTLIRFER